MDGSPIFHRVLTCSEAVYPNRSALAGHDKLLPRLFNKRVFYCVTTKGSAAMVPVTIALATFSLIVPA
jgi:hypothetical protein